MKKKLISFPDSSFHEERFYYCPLYADYSLYTKADGDTISADDDDKTNSDDDETKNLDDPFLPYRISKRGSAFMDSPMQKGPLGNSRHLLNDSQGDKSLANPWPVFSAGACQ